MNHQEIEQKLGVQARALAQLRSDNDEFLSMVTRLTVKSAVGSVTAGAGKLSVMCFDIALSARPRFVTVEQQFHAIEYAVRFDSDAAETVPPVWIFYVRSDVLWTAPAGGVAITSTAHPTMTKTILYEVAQRLLASPKLQPLATQ
jgi:hypothetical protein